MLFDSLFVDKLVIGRVFAAVRIPPSTLKVQAVLDISQCIDGGFVNLELPLQDLFPMTCMTIDKSIVFNRYKIEDSPSPPLQPKNIANKDEGLVATKSLKEEKEAQRAEKLRQIQLKVDALKQRKTSA